MVAKEVRFSGDALDRTWYGIGIPPHPHQQALCGRNYPQKFRV